jgi:hypothetical protein
MWWGGGGDEGHRSLNFFDEPPVAYIQTVTTRERESAREEYMERERARERMGERERGRCVGRCVGRHEGTLICFQCINVSAIHWSSLTSIKFVFYFK